MDTDEPLVHDAPTGPDESKHDESSSTSPKAQKRKASSPGRDGNDEGSKSPKRLRRDSTAARDGPVISPSLDRRQSASVEEKKRGKRLFGGLLSTLSQTNKSSSQKKRHEIERKQQARVSQQKAEDDKHREERLAKLKAVRRQEQIEWEERVMRTKHDHLLDTARFLETRSEPRIYYLPWELTEDQEDLIKDQIHDAEDLVEKETREFKQRKEQRLTALGVPIKPNSEREPAPESRPFPVEQTPEDAENTSGKVDTDALPVDPPQPHDTAETTNGDASESTNKAGHQQDKEADENEDVMVEGDEDTVIY
ncbi:putative Pinin/SDK/memA/ protein conserved region-domain-containing protein [Seiridium unicorne]|uniref:Pinin/SDK/memA/ protein conserved region-domain-containing protein n=1 Tax=Seiridium unicorne TaxID=138068 RepID=A0ABR2VHE9_9PEZI